MTITDVHADPQKLAAFLGILPLGSREPRARFLQRVKNAWIAHRIRSADAVQRRLERLDKRRAKSCA